jgi:hypothetical protein
VLPRKSGVGSVHQPLAASSQVQQIHTMQSVHHQLQLHIRESIHLGNGFGKMKAEKEEMNETSREEARSICYNHTQIANNSV